MSDSIELLEAIGQDATLRHASADDLAHALEQASASEAFKVAVKSGNSSRLSEELGNQPMHVVQSSQNPGHEEEEDDDDTDDDDASSLAPKPGRA